MARDRTTAGNERRSDPSRYDADQDSDAVATFQTPPTPVAHRSEDNRGEPARKTVGAAQGSGAGAGGGGGPEEYDSDPQGGGGAVRMKPSRPAPETGGDAPVGGSR
jgi:hypothetical protein